MPVYFPYLFIITLHFIFVESEWLAGDVAANVVLKKEVPKGSENGI
jgi:hypothetical protein